MDSVRVDFDNLKLQRESSLNPVFDSVKALPQE